MLLPIPCPLLRLPTKITPFSCLQLPWCSYFVIIVKPHPWLSLSLYLFSASPRAETMAGEKHIPSFLAAAAAKSLQSCLTLCDPIDSSPPGSLVPGILQARTLEWVAISFSNAWKWKVKVKLLSHVWLFETPQIVAYQTPPSMGSSFLVSV